MEMYTNACISDISNAQWRVNNFIAYDGVTILALCRIWRWRIPSQQKSRSNHLIVLV